MTQTGPKATGPSDPIFLTGTVQFNSEQASIDDGTEAGTPAGTSPLEPDRGCGFYLFEGPRAIQRRLII